jgi:hypothetical protein
MKNTMKETARRIRRTLRTRKGGRAMGRTAIWGD